MKQFMAVYLGKASADEASAWSGLGANERKDIQTRGMAAWGEWMVRNADNIVDSGAPLGRTKRASADGIHDARNNLTAFVIVQAESHEAAAKLFDQHPHFSIFPGDSVEIMEILPMPGSS